jgi:general stress protein CsbA
MMVVGIGSSDIKFLAILFSQVTNNKYGADVTISIAIMTDLL